MKLDWKTVKRCLSQHPRKNIDLPQKENNHLSENELIKVIFKKLNAGISPDRIMEEIGHLDLVASLYQQRYGSFEDFE